MQEILILKVSFTSNNIVILRLRNCLFEKWYSISIVFKSIFIVFLGFFIISCQNTVPNSVLADINIEKNVANIKPFKICDLKGEIKYIPLKNDTILLSGILHIDFKQNFILLSDDKNCFLFDFYGNSLVKIGRLGKGPGEYESILNIKIGANNNFFLQSWGNILEYDLGGRFIKMFTPEVNKTIGRMTYWAVFNDSLFLGQIPNYSGGEKYKAVFFNRNGKTIKLINNFVFLNKKSKSSEDARTSIYMFNGKTNFKEMMNDTLFVATPQFLFYPVYHLNLGKFKAPKEIRELNLFESTKDYSSYIKVRFVFETVQNLFLDCDFGKNSPGKRQTPVFLKEFGALSSYYTVNMLGIYDKSLHELVFVQPEKNDNSLINNGLFNDFDSGPNFYPKIVVNDSTLAMWVDAYQLRAHVASETFKNATPKYPEKKKELEKLANSLSDNDNPVLILCTFKK